MEVEFGFWLAYCQFCDLSCYLVLGPWKLHNSLSLEINSGMKKHGILIQFDYWKLKLSRAKQGISRQCSLNKDGNILTAVKEQRLL